MRQTRTHRLIAAISAVLPVVVLAGCFELDVETTLSPDGSGERRMELLLSADSEEDEETGLSVEDFQALYGFTEGNGWKMTVEGSGSEMVRAFRRLSKTDNLAEWAQPRGDINIKGTLEGGPYKEVAFRNSVRAWIEDTPGGRVFKYREKFYWEGLGEALIDGQVEAYKETLRVKYPELAPEQMGKLIGLLQGTYWAAVEDGMYEMGEEERARRFRPLADRVTKQGVRLLKEDYSEVDEEQLAEMVFKIVIERDERDEDFLEEKLLGATLALLTELRIRVNMPGEIVDSNASSQQNNTLIWRLEPGHAVDNPIEIYAESMLAD